MDIKKNIFLTGNINVGKSTILKKIIKELKIKTSGFLTLPYIKQGELLGFYIKSLIDESEMLDYNKIYFIGRKSLNDRWEAYPEIFDSIGVRILKDSLKSKKDVIIMDELGFFETNALKFQEYVFRCLDSHKIVFGVVKPAKTVFLNNIRYRDDVLILEINKENRDNQYKKIKSIFEEVLKCHLFGTSII